MHNRICKLMTDLEIKILIVFHHCGYWLNMINIKYSLVSLRQYWYSKALQSINYKVVVCYFLIIFRYSHRVGVVYLGLFYVVVCAFSSLATIWLSLSPSLSLFLSLSLSLVDWPAYVSWQSTLFFVCLCTMLKAGREIIKLFSSST